MEELKVTRKHFSKIGLCYLIGVVALFALQIGLQALLTWLKPEWLENSNVVLFVLSFVPIYAVGMPLIILLMKKNVPAKAPEQHSMKVGQFLLAVMMCYCLMILGNLVGTVITTLIGFVKGGAVDNVLLSAVGDTNMFLTVLYTVIAAPFAEEFIFRKLIVDSTVRYGQGVSIVLSGLMFGLFHGNLNQFAYAFLMGMFLAFLYVKTGKLKYTIGIHMIVNFVGSVIGLSLVKALNLDEYMEAAASGDPNAVMDAIMSNLPVWILYMVFVFVVFAVVITGIVLFIVFRKKFTVEPGEVVIPRKKRFSTVILNLGMILYCLVWIGLMIWQLIV